MSIIYDALKRAGKISNRANDPKSPTGIIFQSTRPADNRNILIIVAVFLVLILALYFKKGKQDSPPLKQTATIHDSDIDPISTSANTSEIVGTGIVRDSNVAIDSPVAALQEISPEPKAQLKPSPEKQEPVFVVSGIFESNSGYFAIINGKVVEIGDQVEGVMVEDIGFQGVRINSEGESKILNYP